VAEPLGVSLEEALVQMEAAYFAIMAESFADVISDPADTTIAAFGGAGPMSACGAARLNNVKSVLIPKLAAIFSAFGIGFSDLGQSYEVGLSELSIEAAKSVHDLLFQRAERDMFQEGHELAACALQWNLVMEEADGTLVSETPYNYGDAPVGAGQQASLKLDVTFELPHANVAGNTSLTSHAAAASGTRQVRSSTAQVDEIQVYSLLDQEPGATALGPAIVEGPFFTARVLDGWKLDVTIAGDLMLTDTH
jgi:N-methylhydantoinase A/oxoprolinase/acetone carboxylase beta subunit